MPGLAPLLRQLRETAQLTQEELADRAGVSARTISDTERGLRSRLYTDTAGRLADALDLDGPERDTFLAISRGRSGTRPEVPGSVPHPLSEFLGRTAEVELVGRELAPDGSRRLVTVTGLGGTGKTRLAIAAATELQARYDGRARFVPMAALETDQVADAVAAVLSTVSSRIAAAVADRPTLVVLDAFEHVIAAADWLADLLERAPALRVLVTSRERLGVIGERELPLGPLGAADAAQLFLDRAHDLVPELAVDGTILEEICKLTSGLPLPLELAAAQVRYLPPDLLRDRLRDGITDVSRVVDDAVAWSISSLSDDERAVLTGTAMFAAGCRLDALQAVCAEIDVVPALGQLVDRSLVQLDRTGADPRWRMLDAVRDAAARLATPDSARRDAYTGFYLDFLRAADQQLGNEQAWYQRLAAEEPNVHTALVWAQERGDAGTLLRLATGMWQFWQSRGALDEGRRWLEGGLAMQPRPQDELRATALWGVAWLAYHQADDDAAERAGRELADLAGDGDDLPRRHALTIEGIVAIARDRAADAIALLTEALGIARRHENRWVVATSLLNLALAHIASDAPDVARPLLSEALRRYDEIGDRRFHARCVGYLGIASLLDGEPDRARSLFLQSLTVFRGLADPTGIAEALAGLAAVEAATGEPGTAALVAGAAERVRDSMAARELPLERRVARQYLGAAARQLGTDAWEAAWQRGRLLDPDDLAVELGLSSQDAGRAEPR